MKNKIQNRIKELENFKLEAKSYKNWLEVDDELFEKYHIDRKNMILDKYYTGSIIDAIIYVLQRIIEEES